jgi:hypothetical protein
MYPAAVAAIVGAAGSFVGLLTGAGVTLKVERDRRTAEHDGELTKALIDYIGALELVAIEISDLPAPSRLEQRLDRIPEGRVGFAARRLLQRVVLGRRYEEVIDLYHSARAEVLLLAPIEMIGQVIALDELLGEWEKERTPELRSRWLTQRDTFRLTAQSTVDKYQGRPYRAGGKTKWPGAPHGR